MAQKNCSLWTFYQPRISSYSAPFANDDFIPSPECPATGFRCEEGVSGKGIMSGSEENTNGPVVNCECGNVTNSNPGLSVYNPFMTPNPHYP